MKISVNWLKKYIDFDQTPAEVAEAITRLGLEVEGVESLGVAPNELLVVGEVLTRDKHPNADKLSVCTVNVGADKPLQIVCGAQNYKVGDRVPVALVGCVLPGDFKIKESKLRGVDSQGMMCAPDEIGLGGSHEGLLILEGRPALGRKVHELFSGDTILEVKATPNRSDALSHLGIARDLAAKWNLKVQLPKAPRISGKSSKDFRICVEDAQACPHYRGYVIRGVKVGPSPAWLQELIKAVGLRPISNVVDITNFILHGLGQPLHAFDLNKISGNELVIRRAQQGEKIKTLDGKDRVLESSMLVIADTQKPLVVAGIMGGSSSEVSAETTDLLLEAAHFNPTVIRRAARKLQLSSDSSYRFERGIDPLGVQAAAEAAVQMIVEITGGKLDGGAIVAGEPPHQEKKIALSKEFLVTQLGFDVSARDIETALKGFGFALHGKGRDAWEVTVPSYRLDIERPVDFVEEVLRFHGVDQIPAAALVLPANDAADDRLYTLTHELSRRLIALGYNECMHYTLRSRAEADNLEKSSDIGALHALENPLSAEMSALRASLVPGLVEALELNRSRGNALMPLFEAGHVFRTCEGKLYELQSIAFARVITPRAESWQKNTPAPDFFDAKAMIEALLHAAHVCGGGKAVWEGLTVDPLWQSFHSARIAVGGISSCAGIVNLEVTKAAGFAGTVLAGEILLPLDAFKAAPKQKRSKAFSAFPGTRRDVALIVKAETPAGEVQATLRKLALESAAGKFDLENVSLFDLYQGQGVPEGHKSLAFALHFRAMDRTLTDDEVGKAFNDLLGKLKAAGYQLRA